MQYWHQLTELIVVERNYLESLDNVRDIRELFIKIKAFFKREQFVGDLSVLCFCQGVGLPLPPSLPSTRLKFLDDMGLGLIFGLLLGGVWW